MSALSISLTPGALPKDGDLITNSTLRAIARPTIDLTGSIGAADIEDGSIGTAALADGVLSADATGRAKMADGYITEPKFSDVCVSTRALMDAAVTAAKLAAALDLSTHTVILPAGSVTAAMLAATLDLTGHTITLPASAIAPSAAISALNIDWSVAAGFYKTITADSTFTFSNVTEGKTIRVAIYSFETAELPTTATFPAVKWNTVGTSPGAIPKLHYLLAEFTQLGGVIFGQWSEHAT